MNNRGFRKQDEDNLKENLRRGIFSCPDCNNKNTICVVNPLQKRKIICWDCNKICDVIVSNPQDIVSKSGMKFKKGNQDKEGL